MAKVDALEVWRKISVAKICKEAVHFFNQSQIPKKDILKQGAADFDKKASGKTDEKAHYRAVYYMSGAGYMSMHIKQNRVSNNAYLDEMARAGNDILFVDFGCGPMTAGLTAAEIFSRYDSNYKQRTFYAGIDISRNMRILAEGINLEFQLFNSNKFCIAETLKQVADSIDFRPTAIVFSLSYVLSPDTLSKTLPKSLAAEWHEFVESFPSSEEVRVIYHNPDGNFHQNWEAFCHHLGKFSQTGRLSYSLEQRNPCEWDGHRASTMAMIEGTKKAES